LIRKRNKVRKLKSRRKNLEQFHNSLINALDEVGIGVDIIDSNFMVKYQNKAMTEKYGDLRGKLCYETYMRRTEPCELCSMQKAITSKRPEIREIIDPEGQMYQLVSSPIKDRKGRVTEVLDLIINITEYKNLEMDLIKSERLMRETFENASDAIFWADVETGQIINCNRTAEILLEKDKDEIIGTSQQSLHPPDKRDFYIEMFKRHVKAKGASEDEAEIMTKSGRRIPVYISVSRITINGRSFMQGIFRDMREQKKKLAQINLLTSAIAQTNEGIAVSDLMGNIVFANIAFAAMHGYNSEELIGKNLSFFHSEEQLPSVEGANELVKKEGKFTGEIWHKRKDGTTFPTLMTSTLLKDNANNPVGMIGVVKEISELKETEKQLKRSREKYRTAFKKADFLRDLFSHDVNNIFQSILSASEILKMVCREEKKSDEVLKNLMIIENQVIRGKTLISNIRKLTQLDASEIAIVPINLLKCIEKSIEYVTGLYEEKHINIAIRSPIIKAIVRANKLLFDIFNNLFINAVEYNTNPIIEIIVEISRDIENGYIKVEVIDNAMGIPDKYKEKIFQRGYDEQHITKGFGLGLALVNKILDRFKGKIWVEDRVGGDYSQGSKFIILIHEAEEEHS
jgi:PAS domain S-box-containing protein